MDSQNMTKTYAHDGPIAPLEIFKEIVDNLAASYNEPSSLQAMDNMKNVALVCKSFVHLARAHLFYEIDLSAQHDDGLRRLNLARLLEDHDNGLFRVVRRVKYTFVDGTEHQCEAPKRELLRIFQNLPQVRSLSLTTKKATRYAWLDRSRQPPLFGWRAILEGFIHRDSSMISEVNIDGIYLIPLLTILSTPSLTSLQLANWLLNNESAQILKYELHPYEGNIQAEPCAPFPNLESLRIQKSNGPTYLPFVHVARCTQLRHLVAGGAILFPRYPAEKLSSRLGYTPFLRLESLEFTNGYEVQWHFFYAAANEARKSAFPSLKTLAIQMDRHTCHQSAEILSTRFYEVFNHTPALESLRMHGYHLPKVHIAHCLNPVGNSLKSLSLRWDFGDKGFETSDRYSDDEDEPGRLTIPNAFQTLLPLRLPALEDLTLHIQLVTGIYDKDTQGLPLHRSLTKSIHSLLERVVVRGYDTMFPSLRRMEVKVTMTVYEKVCSDVVDEEHPYRLCAVDLLTKCLQRFEGKGKFDFFFDLDVYRRSTRE